MIPYAGLWLLASGLLHTAYGVAGGKAILAEMARSRFFNAVEGFIRPSLLFWFLMFGFLLFPLGHLCFWLERVLQRPLPAFLGWELLALSVLGVWLDPDSGFWLVLALSLNIIVGSRRRAKI